MIGLLHIFIVYVIFNFALALYSLKKERIKKFTFYFILINLCDFLITQNFQETLDFFISNALIVMILLIILFLIDKIGGYYEK